MNIVVTGSNGFVAKNLLVHLQGMETVQLTALNRTSNSDEWQIALDGADVVFHLAGTNRPPDPREFLKDNTALTEFIIERLESGKRSYKLIFSSSTQAAEQNPYGESKKAAEDYIRTHVKYGSAFIYRLPGVFGKWARPNYNSVVATYCYNATHGLPLEVRDPDYPLQLVYVDDVLRSFIELIQQPCPAGVKEVIVEKQYLVKLGSLAAIIHSFKENRNTLFLPQVGDALEKALYSTWLTYLPETEFSYKLELKTDNRGSLFDRQRRLELHLEESEQRDGADHVRSTNHSVGIGLAVRIIDQHLLAAAD